MVNSGQPLKGFARPAVWLHQAPIHDRQFAKIID